MNKQKNDNKNEMIKTLLKQSARWTMVSNQDKNPIIALLHANYGASYLSALRDIATDQEIEAASDVDITKFRNEIIREQDLITKHVMKLCPKYSPKKVQLAKVAGEA